MVIFFCLVSVHWTVLWLWHTRFNRKYYEQAAPSSRASSNPHIPTRHACLTSSDLIPSPTPSPPESGTVSFVYVSTHQPTQLLTRDRSVLPLSESGCYLLCPGAGRWQELTTCPPINFRQIYHLPEGAE